MKRLLHDFCKQKSRLVLTSLFLFLSAFLPSQVFAKVNVPITLETRLGYENLLVGEYVFDESRPAGVNPKLSYLDWKSKSLFENTIFSLGIKRFTISGSLKFNVGIGGTMEDFDWQYDEDYSYNTEFSHHDLLLGYDFAGFVAVSAKLIDTKYIDFSVFAKDEFRNLYMMANGGYGFYTIKGEKRDPDTGEYLIDPNTGEIIYCYKPGEYYEHTWNLDETVIAYNPSYNSILIGLELAIRFFSRLELKSSFEYCVNFYAPCIDYHFIRDTDFLDIIKGSACLNYNFSLGYKFSQKYMLNFGIIYSELPICYGESYKKQSNSDTWNLSEALGGFSFTSTQYYCGLKITF